MEILLFYLNVQGIIILLQLHRFNFYYSQFQNPVNSHSYYYLTIIIAPIAITVIIHKFQYYGDNA